MNNFNIKNIIKVSICGFVVLLMAAFVPVSAVETRFERSAAGHSSEQLSIEQINQIIKRDGVDPAYIKSSFAEILEKKRRAKSEEEHRTVKQNLETLLEFSFILGDINRKRPREATKKEEEEARNEEYSELINCVNKKILAVIAGKGEKEMCEIDREFAEEKETEKQNKEKSEELSRKMQGITATLRASNDEGENVMAGFARFFGLGWYAPAEDPRRRGMEIEDGSTAMVEEVPDDTPATRSSSGAASGARPSAPGTAGRLPRQGR